MEEARVLAGRYELRERLGERTWLATDRELGRDVAVRFGDVTGATLSHPAIARVFDQGEEDGERYAVLEYLPGGTLAERGALTADAAAGLAAALAYAHSQSVPHGALDADSILFDGEGRAKLTGFRGEGDPAADLAALDSLRSDYAATAITPPPPEEATLVQPPPPPPPRPQRGRRGLVAAVLAAVALAATGLAAAFLAGGEEDGDNEPAITDPITGVTDPTTTDEEEPAPPPTTTEDTTTATTETQPTTSDTEPTPTTVAPPPTDPPLPTIPPTEPPELPTEPPTTEEPPPLPTITTP